MHEPDVLEQIRRLTEARVVLTSERRERRFLILVNGLPLWLTHSPFCLMLALVAARAVEETGGFISDDTTTYPVAICRLRQAFDTLLGEGAGRHVVETGVTAEYRLAPTIEVTVRPSFSFHPRLVPAELIADVRRACSNADLPEESAE